MDYLVEFIITIPDDAPPPEIEQRLAGETTRVAELAAQGHALRVWKPLPEDGRRRALGLYRAASDEAAGHRSQTSFRVAPREYGLTVERRGQPPVVGRRLGPVERGLPRQQIP